MLLRSRPSIISGVFTLVQILGLACLQVRSPFLLKMAGAILLFPATLVAALVGRSLIGFIMQNRFTEVFSVGVFFSVNAVFWWLLFVARHRIKQRVPEE